MYKAKLLLVSTLVVLAVGAVAATYASATTQFELTGRESDEFAENPTMSETEPLVLAAEKEPTIECKKVQLEKGVVKNDSPEATFKSIHFASCVDASEPACEVPTIETVEMKDTLEKDGSKEGETDEKFAPKSGKGEEAEIAHFKLKSKKGEECKETKELKLEGSFDSKKEDNAAKEDSHHLGFEVKPEAGDTLKYGDQVFPALFMLSFSWTLVNVVTWGLG
jgi:hypothetical protein